VCVCLSVICLLIVLHKEAERKIRALN
jgi:hypothetical protein